MTTDKPTNLFGEFRPEPNAENLENSVTPTTSMSPARLSTETPMDSDGNGLIDREPSSSVEIRIVAESARSDEAELATRSAVDGLLFTYATEQSFPGCSNLSWTSMHNRSPNRPTANAAPDAGTMSEAADFLDMDFDVEPNSDDDDDDDQQRQQQHQELDIPPCEVVATIPGTRSKNPNAHAVTNDNAVDDDVELTENGPSSSIVDDVYTCVKHCQACKPSSSGMRTSVVGCTSFSPGSSEEANLRLSHRCRRQIRLGGQSGVELRRGIFVMSDDVKKMDFNGEPGSHFLWQPEDARRLQIAQIGPSSCGATALLNVFRALNDGSGDLDMSVSRVESMVATKLRANDAPVPAYLMSRSIAGTDAEDLIEAAGRLSSGRVSARFFHLGDYHHPPDERCIGRWLLHWLKLGAVPVLTLNEQRGLFPTESVPDAWHHQMVYGICTKTSNIYMTNPLECVPLRFLKHKLCSPSALLVRSDDVLERWRRRDADLTPLLAINQRETPSQAPRAIPPSLWTEMNVLGQVANVIRESASAHSCNAAFSTHISIPARYRSGVTLFARSDSRAWSLINRNRFPNVSVYENGHTDGNIERDFAHTTQCSADTGDNVPKNSESTDRLPRLIYNNGLPTVSNTENGINLLTDDDDQPCAIQ